MMRAANPYNYNLPVEDKMFYGRQVNVETLTNHLLGTPGDSFGLIGGRRMGKTSLLEALFHSLEPQKAVLSNGVLPLPIFVNLIGGSVNSVETFFRTFAAKIQSVLENLQDLPSVNTPTVDEGSPPAPAFEPALQGWGKIVMKQRGFCPRLIFLLDECEQIVEQPWTDKLYDALRYLLESEKTRSLFKVVMAGSHRFLTQVKQRGSPLGNILKYHTLYTLDEQATRALINQPTGDVLSEMVIQIVIKQSGGHPFLTQYLMHHLWEYGLDNATSETVWRIAAGFPRKRHDFQDWVEGLGDSRLRVYKALAQASEELSEDQVKAASEANSERILPDLPQALEALCYHGLVVRDVNTGNYRVTGDMFHEWFMTNIEPILDGSAVEPPKTPQVPDISLSPEAHRLRRILETRLNLDDLRTLCFDLGLDIDDLPGEGRQAKARELVKYLQMRDDLPRLVVWLRENRSDIEL